MNRLISCLSTSHSEKTPSMKRFHVVGLTLLWLSNLVISVDKTMTHSPCTTPMDFPNRLPLKSTNSISNEYYIDRTEMIIHFYYMTSSVIAQDEPNRAL